MYACERMSYMGHEGMTTGADNPCVAVMCAYIVSLTKKVRSVEFHSSATLLKPAEKSMAGAPPRGQLVEGAPLRLVSPPHFVPK